MNIDLIIETGFIILYFLDFQEYSIICNVFGKKVVIY